MPITEEEGEEEEKKIEGGVDANVCGWEDIPCKTITHAMKQLSNEIRTVSLIHGAYETSHIHSTITSSLTVTSPQDEQNKASASF